MMPRRWCVISRKWTLQDLYFCEGALLRGMSVALCLILGQISSCLLWVMIVFHTFTGIKVRLPEEVFFNNLQALGFAFSFTPI